MSVFSVLSNIGNQPEVPTIERAIINMLTKISSFTGECPFELINKADIHKDRIITKECLIGYMIIIDFSNKGIFGDMPPCIMNKFDSYLVEFFNLSLKLHKFGEIVMSNIIGNNFSRLWRSRINSYAIEEKPLSCSHYDMLRVSSYFKIDFILKINSIPYKDIKIKAAKVNNDITLPDPNDILLSFRIGFRNTLFIPSINSIMQKDDKIIIQGVIFECIVKLELTLQ